MRSIVNRSRMPALAGMLFRANAGWVSILAASLFLTSPAHADEQRGTVVDAATHVPIAGAIVTIGDRAVTTDATGQYRLPDAATPLHIRAPGYQRETIAGSRAPQLTIRLKPFLPKALYLTVYGIGTPSLRDSALAVIERASLNAIVIDLKGDRGVIPYPSALALAASTGALRLRTIADLKELTRTLKAKGIYTIARIVVFKDDLLAQARPDWAVRTSAGTVWKDREGLAWIDPYRKEAWSYTLGVAEEAAAAGFDEIQFDYVRFPDAVGLTYMQVSTEASRVEAITGFLREARRRLVPYNVFLAVDAFGYVCWNPGDTGIGQRLEDLAAVVDYISPMLYPSGFQFGIPGYSNPVTHPYEVVYRSLEAAKARTRGSAVRYRPWLQGFRDYAFGGQPFGADEIGKQIKAAHDAQAIGWMLWNPRNVYSADEIRPAR